MLEMLVTLAVGAILISAAYGIFLAQHRSLERVADYSHVAQSARMVLEQAARELRMAGFGVVTGEPFTVAKKYEFTFAGDIDGDISGVLADVAGIGATEIKVDLQDERDQVEPGDFIFINGGGNVELIEVRSSGDPVSFLGEPDTIYLKTSLENAYLGGETLVRTIEQVGYNVVFPGGLLKRNDVVLAEGLADLEFHYYKEDGTELVPDAVNGLNSIERSAVRQVEIRLETQGLTTPVKRRYSQIVELRNMGNRPFNSDTCPPNQPTGLMVTDTGTCEHFTVTWVSPTTNACDGTTMTDLGGFKIYYGTESTAYFSPPSNVANETTTSFEVFDPRLENNTAYYATIVAYDSSFNESDRAAEIMFTLVDTDPPEAPEIFDATAGVGTVTVSWETAESDDVKGYRLYRSDGPDVPLSADHRVADETVLDLSAVSFTDNTVQACVTYHYALTSVDCANESETAVVAYGDGTADGADSPTLNVTSTTAVESPPSPPGSPAPFQAIGRDSGVDLVWTNPTDPDFGGVMVRYSQVGYPAGPMDGTLVDSFGGTPGQAMNHSVTGLTNGTQYYFTAFAFDRCRNYSEAVTATAVPYAAGPIIEISSPGTGVVVETGQIVFQARAYDPDQPGVSEPPSFTSDNGKGITAVAFYVTPDPGVGTFPLFEYAPQYCGFGGDTDPCGAGNVSQWCDGTYQFYAVAFDDDGANSVSPYISVTVHNGGLALDETYIPIVDGSYDNQITFRVTNDSSVDATVTGVTGSWDKVLARLQSVEMPSGDTVWQSGGTPALSGAQVPFDPYNEPMIAPGATTTIQLVFTQMSTTLSQSATAGATMVTVESSAGFATGETVYVIEGSTTESVTIANISGNQLSLSAPLGEGFGYGATVRHTALADDISMHGADVRAAFDYEKVSFGGRTCASDEMSVPLTSAPVISSAQQDQPAPNTNCSTTLGYMQVDNYRDVPVHLEVADFGGSGIATVKAYYFTDSLFQSVAPESGYASQPLLYNASNSRWEATIPYQSDVRVWLYFVAEDNNAVTDREPESGTFAYDYIPDTTPPSCPLGLIATGISKDSVLLSWTASPDLDLSGYNVYASLDCGSFAKNATLVTDEDPATPGVQFTTSSTRTDKYCFRFYVTGVDQQGNESTGCDAYTSNYVGDCPCL